MIFLQVQMINKNLLNQIKQTPMINKKNQLCIRLPREKEVVTIKTINLQAKRLKPDDDQTVDSMLQNIIETIRELSIK